MINPKVRAKDRIYSELPEELKTLMRKYILSEAHKVVPQPYHDLPDRDLLLRQPRRGHRCREALGCIQRHAQRRDRL